MVNGGDPSLFAAVEHLRHVNIDLIECKSTFSGEVYGGSSEVVVFSMIDVVFLVIYSTTGIKRRWLLRFLARVVVFPARFCVFPARVVVILTKRMKGELKQITDINFEGMSFNVLREIMRHLVLGTMKRLYYCSIKNELNVGFKELKTDKDVEDFLRVGYENKWFVNLYVEHFNYDVLDFLNNVGNVNETPYESCDEYYSSDEVEELDYVDFHTEGEENVVIKNLTTQDPFLNKLCSNHGPFRVFIDEPILVDQEPIHDATLSMTQQSHGMKCNLS
ncbi:hypothetical protein Tco_1135288 [Tanacetum coccineum]